MLLSLVTELSHVFLHLPHFLELEKDKKGRREELREDYSRSLTKRKKEEEEERKRTLNFIY